MTSVYSNLYGDAILESHNFCTRKWEWITPTLNEKLLVKVVTQTAYLMLSNTIPNLNLNP